MNDKKMAHWILICAALSFAASLAFGSFEDAPMREFPLTYGE